jgi:hypothetical protein
MEDDETKELDQALNDFDALNDFAVKHDPQADGIYLATTIDDLETTAPPKNLAPTLQESEDIPDDATEVVQGRTSRDEDTDHQSNPDISNRPKMQESVLKWAFNPSNTTTSEIAHKHHATILKEIYKQFPSQFEACIPGKIVGEEAVTGDDIDDVLETGHTIYEIREHRNRNGITNYEIYHRIHHSVTLSTIKANRKVNFLLQTHKVRVYTHAWTEDIQDVVDLGWFVNHNPGIGRNDEMHGIIKEEIKIGAKCDERKIPRFVIYGTTVSVQQTGNNNRANCRAYTIQCRKKDVGILKKQLAITYSNSGKFLFYSEKHINVGSYARAIRVQGRYIEASRVVAIAGIPPDAMWSFEPFLRQKNPMIHRVLTTSRTTSEGRFNLETTERYLFKLAEFLDQNIEALFKEFLNSPIVTYTCPPDEMFVLPPHMASKNLTGNSMGEDDDRTVRTAYTGGTSFYSRYDTSDRSDSSKDDDSDDSILHNEQPRPPPTIQPRAPQLSTGPPVTRSRLPSKNANRQSSAFRTYAAAPRTAHGIFPPGRPGQWNNANTQLKTPPTTATDSSPPTTAEAKLIQEIRELKEGMAKLMQENRTLLQERQQPHQTRASRPTQEPSPPIIPTEIFTTPLPPLPPPLVSQSPAVSSVTGMLEYDGKLQAVLQESRLEIQEAKRQQREDQAAMRQEFAATTQRQEMALAELKQLLEGALEHRSAAPPAFSPRPLPRSIAFDSETEHPSKRPDLKQSPAKGASRRPLAARRDSMTDAEGDPPNPNNDTSSPG